MKAHRLNYGACLQHTSSLHKIKLQHNQQLSYCMTTYHEKKKRFYKLVPSECRFKASSNKNNQHIRREHRSQRIAVPER